MPCLRRLLRLRDMPAREVRGSDVEDLALRTQDLHRLPDLVERRVPVDVVHLIQVDVVGLQPLKRRIARPPDVQRGKSGVVGPVTLRAVHLRREDRTLPTTAALGEPAPQHVLDPFAPDLESVHVGRVDQVDAVLVRAVHDREGLRLRGDGTEAVGLDPQSAHEEARTAKVRVFHGDHPVLRHGSCGGS